ncbi:hypothetical protein NEF87_004901 [Candidatus Lokiarchaeum ossiferum]|uniref:HD-CE domain-containing protein n=1 Tax=Candidatus Lokiarchaeum ossiferum TaxID=2951803 RepID=A0ABY6I1C0_9ARCH|nr:hypothetical protein NEF87_004901 [Candidatus Lokiarchaeum sp. B-35]
MNLEDNSLVLILKEKQSDYYHSLIKVYQNSKEYLMQYIRYLPDFTDHSIIHSDNVLKIITLMLEKSGHLQEIVPEEIYVLCCATILHDIGMGVPDEFIENHKESLHNYNNEDVLSNRRTFHHVLSKMLIQEEWEKLKIIDEKFAEAIGLVAQGHRKVNLNNFYEYNPRQIVSSGVNYVNLPYLSWILRLGDELDLTNNRLNELVLYHYPPPTSIGETEINKHRGTFLLHFGEKYITIEAKTSDRGIYHSLKTHHKKIGQLLKDFHKTITSFPTPNNYCYDFPYIYVESKIVPLNFTPMDIGFSVNNNALFKYFINAQMYSKSIFAVRECV